MKVISIKQPFAQLIVKGIKNIENRTWACPEKYIGQRILIHSSATSIKHGHFYTYMNRLLHNDLELKRSFFEHDFRKLGTLHLSAIIGSVKIVDCTINHPSKWAEKCDEVYSHKTGKIVEAIYNWVLEEPILFEKPIFNIKGRLGFWDYDYDDNKQPR